MTNPDSYVDSHQLKDLVELAREDGIAGIDTEFIRERSYFPQLALIQLVVGETCVLIDPLQGTDLSPLDELLQDSTILKVFHAGSQDLEIFYHLFKKAPKAIFDTQVAAAMVGIGSQQSLSNLCHAMLSVVLKKGESYSDWLARPLNDAQEHYALEDVRYLLPLYDALDHSLEDLGRTAWLDEELKRYENPRTYSPDPREMFWSVKRSSHLDRRALAVLRELAAWREMTAQSRNVPRRAVISDEALLEVARRRPMNANALRSIRGLHPNEASRSAHDIAKLIKVGLDVHDDDCPRPIKRKRLEGDQELVAHITQAFLQIHCAEQNIDPGMVANSSDIENIIRGFAKESSLPSNLPIASGWRREIAGEAILDLLEGRSRLRIATNPFRGIIEAH